MGSCLLTKQEFKTTQKQRATVALVAVRSLKTTYLQGRGIPDNTSHIGETAQPQAAKQLLTLCLSLTL